MAAHEWIEDGIAGVLSFSVFHYKALFSFQ